MIEQIEPTYRATKTFPVEKYGSICRLYPGGFRPWLIAQAIADARFEMLKKMIQAGMHCVGTPQIEVTLMSRAVSDEVPDNLQFPLEMRHVVISYPEDRWTPSLTW